MFAFLTLFSPTLELLYEATFYWGVWNFLLLLLITFLGWIRGDFISLFDYWLCLALSRAGVAFDFSVDRLTERTFSLNCLTSATRLMT